MRRLYRPQASLWMFIRYTIPTHLADVQDRVNYVRDRFGDKPIITWEGWTGGNDSPYPADSGNNPRELHETQLARGEKYKQVIQKLQAIQYETALIP